MKRIREGTFETNSSSMHSVTVRGKGSYIKYKIPNVIELYLDEYGWSGPTLWDFTSKLKYAMSMVLHTEYPNFNQYSEYFVVEQEVLENLPGYRTLIEATRKHGDCEMIIINRNRGFYPYGYIDHQSYEDYSSLQDFLDDWHVDAERFLFDDGVMVLIDNDNH